uniref:CSON014251 protein n=1 Tax=Culicoides sonorensis TaxID=179676 RepID=A0A336MFR8_CULSO
MSSIETNHDQANGNNRNDSGKINCFKNLKNYRDHGESFEEVSFGDSGYGNSRHLTFNSTEPGSLTRQSTSILKTIDEEPREIVTATPASTSRAEKKVTILTPTTQSIQKMSNLHLTTPEGGMMCSMDMSPFQGPQENFDFIEPKTPPELLLSIQEPRTANSTPRKAKTYGRKRSFRNEIETDTENENVEQKRFRPDMAKDDIDEKLARRMPFSPVVLKANQRSLRHRSVSDNNLGLTLRSSTPKTFLMRSNLVPNVIPKQPVKEIEQKVEIQVKKTPKKTPKKTLRRYQSFSPTKLSLKGKEKVIKNFFQDMKKPSTSTGLCDSFQKSDKGLTNIPEEDIQPSSLLRQNALDISDIQIRDMPASEQCSLNLTEADLSFLNGAGKSISPIKKHPGLENLFEAPIIPLDGLEQDPSINFTTSFQNSEVPSLEFTSFEKPSTSNLTVSPLKKGLLFRDLPRTPSKSILKRTKSKTPSKKRLLEKRSHYYDGMDCLDFINRLHNEGVYHLVEDIFQYLTDEDIINASMVSKKWFNAIQNNKLLNGRRMNYITMTKIRDIENLVTKRRSSCPEMNIPDRKPFTAHNYDTRGMERIRQLSQYSPPASPGKVKFRENQKVVRRLSPRAMTTCPRCAKPSPIITQKKRDCIVKIGRSTRSSAKKTAELRKTLSEPSPILTRYRHTFDRSPVFDLDTSGDSSSSSNNSASERKIRRTLFPASRSNTLPYDISKRNSINSSMNTSSATSTTRSSIGTNHSGVSPSISVYSPDSDSIEEYAMCTGTNCGFRFCVRCKGEYHSNHVCPVSVEINSPVRDEDRNTSNRIGSRQSRRTLKRL